MTRYGAILIAAVALSLATSACASDDHAMGGEATTTPVDQAALFDAGTVLARNAVPTATATPASTPTPRPTPPKPVPTPTPTSTPTAVPVQPTRREIQSLLRDLVADIEAQSPDVSASITVWFEQDTVTATNGLGIFPSASLAKAWWVAAAVDELGADAVEPFVEPIFAISDNDAAAGVLDLVGVDAVNDTTSRWGMSNTYLSSWTLERVRAASDRDKRGEANVTTTQDAALFMHELSTGALLGPGETKRVLAWMRETPFDREIDPFGSVLVADLPVPIAASTAHKAGWLPPDCCDGKPPEHEVLAAAGIVPCRPGALGVQGESFSVALAAVDGNDYFAGLAWMPAATAAIAETLCGDLERWERNDPNGYQ